MIKDIRASFQEVKELVDNGLKNIENYQTYNFERAVEFLKKACDETRSIKEYYWQLRQYDERQVASNLEIKLSIFLNLCPKAKSYNDPVMGFKYLRSILSITNIEDKLAEFMKLANE